MHSVQVLLSTYNGEQHLRPQIDSILAQSDVDLHLFVRDDGSCDSTTAIIEEYALQHKNIKVVKGRNIGYKASFSWLVRNSGDFDFFAFADQDDVWAPDKLSRATEKIAIEFGKNRPVCYCSNCTLVNATGEIQGDLYLEPDVVPKSTREAFTSLIAYGCTVVFTKASRNLILQHTPKGSFSHDFWIATIHFFLADFIYDHGSRIYHRQHNDNVFGGKRIAKQTLFKIKHINDDLNFYQKLAKDLLAGYKNRLSEEDKEFLNTVVHYRDSIKDKAKLLADSRLRRKTMLGTLYIKSLILFSLF